MECLTALSLVKTQIFHLQVEGASPLIMLDGLKAR
jgi:hypothetical protein